MTIIWVLGELIDCFTSLNYFITSLFTYNFIKAVRCIVQSMQGGGIILLGGKRNREQCKYLQSTLMPPKRKFKYSKHTKTKILKSC